MTVQLKHFIELADIIGLRLECANCGCSVSLQDADKKSIYDQLFQASSKLSCCPTCNREWIVNGTGTSYLQQFFRDLRTLREREIEGHSGYTLKLEITGSDRP